MTQNPLPLASNDLDQSISQLNSCQLFHFSFSVEKSFNTFSNMQLVLTYKTDSYKFNITTDLQQFSWPKAASAVVLTYDSSHQTQNNCDGNKGPVPDVFAAHCGNAQKDEDQRLTDTTPHFQEVLDGGVGFMGYVGLHVGSHHRSTSY